MKLEIKDTWDKVWSAHGADHFETWDIISQTVLDTLLEEGTPLAGKKVVEVGSGSGKISSRLAKAGAAVSLLDISPEALSVSRELFARAQVPGKFIEGSMFAMPFPDSTFDMTWNAGVLEHFSRQEQERALTEMARVTKPGGKVVILVPSARAIFYRFGKVLRERLGAWEAGEEIPVRTLAPATPSHWLELITEYERGFWAQLGFLYPRWIEYGVRAVFLPLGAKKFDAFYRRLFGGYLRVAVFQRIERQDNEVIA